MEIVLKFCLIFSLLILTNSCDLESETKNDIEKVEQQIDENIKKVNEEKYNFEDTSDTSSNEEIDFLINQQQNNK
jgi:hypothetical protein